MLTLRVRSIRKIGMTKSPSKYFSHFFTSESALKKRFNRVSRRMAFHGIGRTDALAWQKKARRRFAERLGLPRFNACSPKAKKISTVALDGLVREEWLIQTERDVWMPYYLFIPPEAKYRRVPLVLCPHGHGSAGKWAPGGRWTGRG